MKLMIKVLVLSITLISLTVFITIKGFQFSNINSDTSDGFFQATAYAKKYFDRNKIMQINIDISKENWQEMIINAMQKQFVEANVTVNGDSYPLVSIRPKGNSSLDTIANSKFNEEGNLKRFSLKISFDRLNEAQTLEGLKQLNLNNSFSDPSFIREYLAYQIFEGMGIKVPVFSFAEVSLNGEYFGLFLAVESIQEPYLVRNFGNASGILYKSIGNTLTYSGNDTDDTKGLQIQTGQEKASSSNLMNMIRALNTNGNIEKYLDVDQVLRYIAVCTALVNLDSYQSNFGHNYYLYEQDGKFSILPWDLNMAFGGFNFNGDFTNFYIDEPTQGNVKYWPLIDNLLKNEDYLPKYHAYLQEIINKYLNKTYLETEITRLVDLISSSVYKDPTALYTYEDFQANTSLLVTKIEPKTTESKRRNFVRERASFSEYSYPLLSFAITTAETIQKQLNGDIASNNNGNGMPGALGVAPSEGQNTPETMQNITSKPYPIWFLVTSSIILVIGILMLLFLKKRKWISAG